MSVDPRAIADTLNAQCSDHEAFEKNAWSSTLYAPTPREAPRALPPISMRPPGEESSSAARSPHVDLALHSLLGRGGMGEVWIAEQSSLRRNVAVKLPVGGAGDSAGALVSEARISGSLEHPNIVPVHALGLTDDGRPVLIMKRVLGATLSDLVADVAHSSWAELIRRYGDRQSAIAEILMRVSDAIAFAHSRDIVHRDLKPENVMVGEFGEVYVLDWGCAVTLPAVDLPFAGTPSFMAPEMIDPHRGPIDARTDVYLLGATLHAALTGRPRHEGRTLEAVILSSALSQPVEYEASVSAELAEICNRATHGDRTQRFSSATEFREALGRALRLRAMTALADRIVAEARLDEETASGSLRLKRLEEARYALAPLVAEWPTHARLRAQLDRILVAIVRAALAQRQLPAAQDALAAATAPEAELVEAVTRLRASLEKSDELASVGAAELRERDVRPGLKGLLALVALMALNTVLLVGTIAGGKEPSMKEVVLTDLVALAVVAVTAFALRGSLMANRRGRSMTAAVFLITTSTTVCEALAAFMGQTARQAAPFSLLVSASGLAAMAILLALPARARWAVGTCSVVIGAQAFWSAAEPSVATRLLSLSVIEMLLTAAFLVYDMVRESDAARAETT